MAKNRKSREDVESRIGERNIQRWGLDMHNPVFFTSSGLIIVLLVLTLVYREQAQSAFSAVQTLVSNQFGWLLILTVNILLVYSIFLAFGRFSKIRIGGPDARPEFSTRSWFAMLFSAGMGIGVIYWSVAEPITHFSTTPFLAESGTADAAQVGMATTFLHWGFHAWAVYAVVGLALAFFAYNWGLPLTVRSLFYPLLGERIYGWIGDVVDTIAVLATMFGITTVLGLGAGQISAGMNYLFDTPDTIIVEVGIIAFITAIATMSVVAGLDGGVKRLSDINIGVAVVLLAFILVVGPTVFILNGFIENVGFYLQNFMFLGTWSEAYEGGTWQNNWTVFYWAWWVSWAPFVGIFIARISKGRTVREFMLGVTLVPSLVCFFWFSAFGGTALYQALNGVGDIVGAVDENFATAFFVMVSQLPLAWPISLIAVLLIFTFFVTSSDSGSLVIDSITAGGKEDAPVVQRVFWAVTEGAVAAVLLIGGGLTALQTAVLVLGLPFAIVILFVCYSLYKGLQTEFLDEVASEEARAERDEADVGVEPAAAPTD